MSGSQLVADSFGWDVTTWSRALAFWHGASGLRPGSRALEVGADGDNGGLSLWLAAQGHEVTCSGLLPPSPGKLAAHRRHGTTGRVTFAQLDLLALPTEPGWDLIVLKSVLGSIGRSGSLPLQRAALDSARRALSPGGELWFVENAAATALHAAARRRFGAGQWDWQYLRLEQLPALLDGFDRSRWTTFGLTAAGGRTEPQRRLLGRVDRLVDRLVPPSWRYVVAGVAQRSGSSELLTTPLTTPLAPPPHLDRQT